MTLPALLTDLYQLTMMQAYRRAGIHRRRACFDLFFRRAPFGGSFAVAAGIEDAIEDLETLRFTADDVGYLRGLSLFQDDFLDVLPSVRFTGAVWAPREGTIVFPRAPILRVEAPLEEAQLVETMLLTRINFQTLIATKAARMAQAAGKAEVVEFGLRRAQGPDGGLSAAKAAYLGGCTGTSNVEAGRRFGIPVTGTHAHAYVTAFDREIDAFRNYAAAFPRSAVLLVDTYDTLAHGVPNAIQVGREMLERGERLAGVRLDSGDLLRLARETRARLDQAGLTRTRIVASGDLDEYEIERLIQAGAPIDVFGVGTRLTCAYDDPALGGVYKMAAREDGQGRWVPTVKTSDDLAKATLPGRKQVWRQHDANGAPRCDRMEVEGESPSVEAFDPVTLDPVTLDPVTLDPVTLDPVTLDPDEGPAPEGPLEPVLQPCMKDGRRIRDAEALADRRARAMRATASMARSRTRLRDADPYPVVIGSRLAATVRELRARAAQPRDGGSGLELER